MGWWAENLLKEDGWHDAPVPRQCPPDYAKEFHALALENARLKLQIADLTQDRDWYKSYYEKNP